MARNKKVDADQFAIELEEIIQEVGDLTQTGLYDGIKSGLKIGANLWRKHARDKIGKHEYKRSGEVITSGMYARSITSHMTSNDETRPAGEIGSRKLAGLTHLLEKGHARVGGGRVDPVLSIEKDVVPPTYEATIHAVEAAIDQAIK